MQEWILELEQEEERLLHLQGELVALGTPAIRSISVNGVAVPPDLNRNVNLIVPSQTSELKNDSEFTTETDVVQAMETYLGNIIGHGLKLDAGVLSVDTANTVEADNTKPITSSAVYLELGNIEALLQTI